MNQTVNIKQEALKNGLIWGTINIVVFLVSWYVMPNMMTSYLNSFVSILIGIALAVFFCTDMRKKVGGYWTFNEAMWPIFVTFVTGMALTYVFTILFGKFIDTGYPSKMTEMVLANTEETLRKFGLQGSDLKDAMKKTEENLQQQFNPTFKQAIIGFGIAAIMYFIGAVVFALIFRKSNPNPFAEQADEQFKDNQ